MRLLAGLTTARNITTHCLLCSSWPLTEGTMLPASARLYSHGTAGPPLFGAGEAGWRSVACEPSSSHKTRWGAHGSGSLARRFASQSNGAAPNYFNVMGLQAVSYTIDTTDLEKKYRALQFRLHPDKAASGSKEQQDVSAEQSALVNQAYAILKSPLKRAVYLLELQGAVGDLSGEHTIEDMELLQRVMEVREQVDAAREGDLAGLREDNQAEEQECVQAVTGAFERGDLEEAAMHTKRLRYITRVGEAIRQKS